MAKTKTNKKAPAKVAAARKPAKKAAAKKNQTELRPKIGFSILGKQGPELMNNPKVRFAMAKLKHEIERGHERIASPKNYSKIITDQKSKLVVTLVALPEAGELSKRQGVLYVTTIIDRKRYEERTDFETLSNACEYVADFSQEQAKRFCDRALRNYARSVVEQASRQIEPVIREIVENNKKAAVINLEEAPKNPNKE